MALQKQLVHLNLTQGLQKKDDDKLSIGTKLTEADNVEFSDSNVIARRPGQSGFTYSPPVVSPAVRLYEHGGVPIVERENGDHLRRENNSDISSTNKLVRLSAQVNRIQGFEPVTAVSTPPRHRRGFDIAVGPNTYCVVAEDLNVPINALGIRWSIRSVETNNELHSGFITEVNMHKVRPRVIYNSSSFGGHYAIFWGEVGMSPTTGYDIRATAIAQNGIELIAPTLIMTPDDGANNVESSNTRTILFDVAWVASGEYCIAARGTSSALWVRMAGYSGLAFSLGTTNTTAVLPFFYGLTVYNTLALGITSGHIFYDNGISLRSRTIHSTTDILSAESTIGSLTFAGASNIWRTAVFERDLSLVVVADSFKSDATTGKEIQGQQLFQISSSHVLQDTIQTASKCGIAGRVFSLNSRQYIPLVFDSEEFQRCLLVLDLSYATSMMDEGATESNPMFVARVGDVGAYGGATGTERDTLLSSPHLRVQSAYSNFVPFLKYDGNTRLAGEVDTTPVAISRLKLDHDDSLGDESFTGLTYLAGAMPLIYDGKNLVEEGFHWAPEVARDGTLAATTTNNGFYNFPAGAGTYSVAFTMAWQDAQGNWHESAPSKTYTVTTADPTSYGLTGGVLTPPSLKPNATLLMYRTLKNSVDNTMYLAHVEPLWAQATISDANIINGEVLYTEGGVLPNNFAPACRQISTFQKRLVLAGCDDGGKLFWSKQATPGFPAEFVATEPSYQLKVPGSMKRVVGADELDDKLVIICEGGVGVIYGQGPDPTGTQGQYSDFSTTVTEVGGLWASPKSIIRGPEGLWFHAPAGIRLVGRNLSLARGQEGRHVGSEVDAYSAVSRISAACGPAKPQLYFYTPTAVLVWDYHFGQWTRFTGAANVDAVASGNYLYHVNNLSGNHVQLRKFDTTVNSDRNDAGTAGTDFISTITTGWLSFAGIQGFQRVYRLMVLGEGDVALDLDGAFTYNFGTTTGDSFSTSVTPAQGFFQLQHHFAKQKCETVKMSISFNCPALAAGSLKLTDLTLQVGVKSGYFKLPSAQRV